MSKLIETLERKFGSLSPKEQQLYDAGYRAALEDVAKVAENCPIDHLSHHGSMRKLVAAEIRKLGQ